MHQTLQPKTIVITGASSGFGALRTVVMAPGMDFGVDRLNQAVSAIQNELLRTLQFGSMV